MREIVIVISDLYLPRDLKQAEAGEALAAALPGALPGIECVTRFGVSAPLEQGWRGWIARWLDLAAYADQPAASIVAAAQPGAAPERCWLATPLRLIEGLTRVHVDWRCRLRLEPEERRWLAADFNEMYRGSGFALRVLASGELLLDAPPLGPARTTEPARLLQTLMADSLPGGAGAAALRRLGAEIEMWLHEHALNRERRRRGEQPVSTLWIWGGGEPPAVPGAAPAGSASAVFGVDAYVRGLCALAGLALQPAPDGPLTGEGAPRALWVLELAEALQRDARASLAEALADLDRRAVAPALAALRRGEVDGLVLLANDRRWRLRPADRWRLWRGRRAALEALA